MMLREKIEAKKARSIVAMLFWEYKKTKGHCNSSLSIRDKCIEDGLLFSFIKPTKC